MRKLLVGIAVVGALYTLGRISGPTVRDPVYRNAAIVDRATYRLVHAIGNTERYIGFGLDSRECAAERDERRRVSAAIGVGGSFTCLPDRIFD